MRVSVLLLTIGAMPLVACGGDGGGGGLPDSTTFSGFTSVTGSTADVDDLDPINRSDASVSRAAVGTVAYATGLNTVTGQAVAVAGIASGANVGAAVTSGTATYVASYEYQVIDQVVRSSTTISGNRVAESGIIAINADFGAGTMAGTSSELDVSGTISGTSVTGTATAMYSDPLNSINGTVSGPLEGMIGADGVVAAYHGSDDNTVFAGGLVGN